MADTDHFLSIEASVRQHMKKLSSQASINALSQELKSLAAIVQQFVDPALRSQYSTALRKLENSARDEVARFQLSQRDEIFKTTTSPLRDRSKARQKKEDDNSIATTLSRTKKQMEMELSRVAEINDTIVNDGKNLRTVGDEHDTLNNIMSSAWGVLKALSAQDVAERVMIAGATLFFVLSVFFVLWSRLPTFGLI